MTAQQTTTSTRCERRGLVLDLTVAALVGLLFGVHLAGPQLKDRDRFHDNWRQSPHWAQPAQQRFQPGDLIVRYARFNNPTFSNWMYPTLARRWDVIQCGKVASLVYFVLTAMGLYVAGRALGGRVAGWAAMVILLFFPCRFQDFAGGFSSALTFLFLAFTVVAIHRQRWVAGALLLVVETLVYPMAMLQSAATFALDIVLYDRKQIGSRSLWLRKYGPLLLGLGLSLLLANAKFAGGDHGFGKMVTRVEIANRVEFTRAGRSSIIPVPSAWRQVEKYWGSSFHVALFLCAYLLLGKAAFRLPRGLYALLLSAFVLYWLADIFLLRLYFPERYMRRALPVFIALAGGYWLSAIINRTWPSQSDISSRLAPDRSFLAPAVVGLLLALGMTSYSRTYRPGQSTYRYARHDLYDAVRRLPGRPLIAAYPVVAGELPLLTGKSVLVAKEFSHPWWTEYWRTMDERVRDFFRAYYAREPEPILHLLDKYDVDYVLVDRKYYRPNTLARGRLYMEPVNRWVRAELDPGPDSLLAHVPEEYAEYDSSRYQIVSAASLRRWLASQPSVPPEEP